MITPNAALPGRFAAMREEMSAFLYANGTRNEPIPA
jgi:hypothetical protein